MIDIQFSIDGLKTGDSRYDFGVENDISKFYRVMVDRLNALNVHLPQQMKDRYPAIEFPSMVDVKILMVDNKALFHEYFDADAQKMLGFFNLTNSKEILGKTEIPNDFIVVIEADLNYFNHIHEKYSKSLKVTKDEMLSLYCITLTHEITHALEFIENSGGLTPLQVERLFKENLFEYDVDKCSTGYGYPHYQKDYIGIDEKDDDTIYAIMEDRVEAKGRKLYHQLNISDNELSSVFTKPTVKKKASFNKLQ